MTQPSDSRALSLFTKTSLLITELKTDFAASIALGNVQAARRYRAHICRRYCRSFLGYVALAPL